jgi:hypothetical protein
VLHRHSTRNNVFFNKDGMIQIADFCVNRLAERVWNSGENANVGGFSEEDWTPTADIRAFAEILSVTAVGASDGQSGRGSGVPTFVSEIIERGLFASTITRESMGNIFKILQRKGFKVVDGVDSDEVFAFVNWVEAYEQETE